MEKPLRIFRVTRVDSTELDLKLVEAHNSITIRLVRVAAAAVVTNYALNQNFLKISD